VEEVRGHREAAYHHYQTAIGEIEAIRGSLRVDEFKASFLDDKLALYQATVRLSLEMDRLEEAFDYVERAKSSGLLDLLARSLELREEEGEAVDAQAWERLRALKEEWLWHHSKLEGPPVEDQEDALRGKMAGNPPWDRLNQVEAQMRQTLRQLQGRPVYSLVEGKDLSWQEIGRYLAQDTLLIEYFCIGDEVLAFLIGPGGLDVRREFPCSLREVRRSLRALDLALKGVGDLDPAYVREVLGDLARRHLAWLYQALIAPLADVIEGCRKLVFVPHDVLYYLPFHALHDGEQYLVERFKVQYTPSASVLARCYQTRKTEGDKDVRPALVIGYSDGGRLPHAPEEAQAVSTILGQACPAPAPSGVKGCDQKAQDTPLLFVEGEATLARLRQYAGRCRLIHLASHAVFRSDNPLFSSIQLADGPLNVMDLYHLRLDASLVTLSGCETGVSQLKGGDLFGLVRGCLYAGAPALVASLWRVNDASTTLLMETFYRRVEAGASTASALRAAQLALLRYTKDGISITHPRPYEHPYYWAPFILMGVDGVVRDPGGS
jgi:hypothetical protein